MGITGYVSATGETVNIPDAYADPRFDPDVDSNNNNNNSSFKHKSILSMPIIHGGSKRSNMSNVNNGSGSSSSNKNSNSSNGVLGVFQLVNKFDNLAFSKNDENFVEAFAIFCGMGINNVRMYEKAMVAMAKQQVTLEVLSYHASAPVEEATNLARQKIPSAQALRLNAFNFDDFGLDDPETLKVRDDEKKKETRS